jgi:hypothetical protein
MWVPAPAGSAGAEAFWGSSIGVRPRYCDLFFPSIRSLRNHRTRAAIAAHGTFAESATFEVSGTKQEPAYGGRTLLLALRIVGPPVLTGLLYFASN